MRKLLALTLTAVGALLLAVTAACGGDDDENGSGKTMTVEEYFDAVVEIAGRTNTAIDSIDARMTDATYDTESDEVTANLEAFAEIGQALESSAADLGKLHPPEEASAEHDDFQAAVADYAALVALVTDDLDGVSTLDELDAVLTQYDSEGSQVVGAAADTCLALQTVGAQYVDGLDLACPQ